MSDNSRYALEKAFQLIKDQEFYILGDKLTYLFKVARQIDDFLTYGDTPHYQRNTSNDAGFLKALQVIRETDLSGDALMAVHILRGKFQFMEL